VFIVGTLAGLGLDPIFNGGELILERALARLRFVERSGQLLLPVLQL
jgi:hypothetical protein